jgi:VCBS repeat-containing protein/CshA-type fibril repeat protein
VSYNNGTGVFTILPTPSSVALATSFQTLIQGITYINNTDNVTAGNRTVTFNITDAGFDNSTAVGGELGSNTPTTTINVVRTNDQPVITNLNAVSYFENAINTAAAIIDGSITLTDIDSPTYNGGSLTVSGLVAAEDTVSLPVSAAAVSGNVQINGGNVEYYNGTSWVVIGTQSGGAGANFVVSFNASATPAIVQRVIENLIFANSSNNPTLTRTLNLALNDGGTGTVQNVTVDVTIKLDNDAPVMTAAVLGGTYTEQNATPLQFISGAISVSDPDSPLNFYINTAAVAGSLTVALDGYQSGDTLSVLNQGTAIGQIGVVGNTISYGGTAFATTSGGNGAPLVITFTSATATPAAVQALLAQLAFSNTTNDDPTVNNTDPSRVFTVTLNDGGNTKDAASTTTALTATLTGTINLTAVNDKPVVTPAGTAATYTENAVATVVDNTLTVTDADDTQMSGGTVSITGNFLAGDVLAITNTGNITGSYDSATGILTLSGTDTIANYQAVLRSLTYLNSTDDPTDNTTKTTRTLTYSLTDANSDAVGAATSIAATKTINVTPLQDAPVLTGGGATLAYTEQAAAAVIDATVTVSSDADDTQMSGATITLSAGYTAGDILSFTAQNGITVVSNSGGVLVLTGNATLANYTAALRSITFNSTSDTPTIISASRTVTWQVRDANSDAAGIASSNTVTSTINILAINDTPVLTALGNTVNFTEVGTAVVLNNAVTVADVDLSPLSGGAGNYNGTTLTLVRSTGANAEDVFSSTGTLAALTQGSNITVGVTTIGTVTTNSAGTLILTFNTNATSALVNSALQQIAYRNNSTTPLASVQINWLFNDQNPNVTGGGIVGTGQDQGGGGVLTASSSTTINIDRLPTANADINSIAENALNVVGNVMTGATTADDQGDPAATVTGVALGTQATTSGSVNTPIAGSYGSLTLDSTGAYTYTLDNANPAVNALLTGQTLTETYSYTITDADGDTSTTTLKITINGTTDNIPSIVPVDGNAAITGHISVREAGLTSGADTSETNTGTLTLSALDGLASINVGGTAITLAQLSNLGTTPITITTPKGTITLTGYNSTANVGGVSTAGTLTYTYTLTQVQNTPAATENTDNIALSITNAGGNTVTDTLIVQIVDDTPTANADTNSVNEGNTAAATTTSGNVFSGSATDVADRIGADVVANPVTGVAFGTLANTSGNVNSPVAGTYGSLTLNATGGYTYTLDNTNPAVNALLTGQTLTETFSYTITDADGDTSTTTLTITINGFTDSTPEITPIDGNSTETGQATVFEKGLVTPTDGSQTTTGTISVSTPDGIASVTIGGTTFTVAQLATFSVGSPSASINTGEGTLIVTGFNIIAGSIIAPTAGTLTYRYTLNAAQPHTGGSAVTESTDRIILVVTDNSLLSTTATSTLIVRIVDDTPTAKADTNSVIEGTTTAATTTQGNVFGAIGAAAGDVADRIGADVTATPVTGVSFAGSVKTVGSPFNSTYGSLTLNANGSYIYTLDNTNAIVNALGLGQSLSETFSYTITDADGDTSTTTLTITINGRNDAPIAVSDIQIGITGQAVTINVLGNDSDPENNINPATVKIVGTTKAGDSLEVAGQGIWSVNPLTGAITFTPFAGFTADPTPISYTVNDKAGVTSNPATVTVDYPQTPPLAIDNTVTGVTGKPITITVLDNDSDLENDINPATLQIAGTANAGDSLVVAGQGTWSVDVNTGTITFTPNLGFTGNPTPISYTVRDNTGLTSNTARVIVNYPTVIATDTGTSGSLIMLSNPDKSDSSSQYTDNEEKTATLGNKLKPDNQLPSARLSLYVPIRNYVISLTGSLRDQVVLELERYSFSVPRWMFRHTNPNEQLEFEAARPDGSSLPEWLTFNPKTLKFSGVPPKGAHNERVMVTARDTYGNEVHATFNVHVNKERIRTGISHKVFEKHKLGEKRAVGKAGLSEQIHAMGKLNKLQESRALLDGFKNVVALADE